MVKGELGRQQAKVDKRAAYTVQPLEDVHRIRAFLMENREYAAYALGCLQPRLFPATEWWLAQGDGAAALLLHCRGSLGASLFAMGDPQALDAALSLHPGPRFAFAIFQVEHLPTIERQFVVLNRQVMQRMVATAETFQPVAGQARRLHRSDIGHVNHLYGSEGGGYYTARHLEESVYYGVFDERGRLVSIAGTHMAGPSEGVAVVGNVFTHRRYRGRGYATIATSAVTAELLKSCPLVALTVDPNNTPAVRAYEKLGYRRQGVLMESAARRKDMVGLASLIRRWLARHRGRLL